MDKEQKKKWNIALMMVRYGGSFASSIGEAYQRADSSNKARLENAFEDLWRDYEKFLTEK